jgi:glutathione synthase/RimK-type ligase-like ATP-grasp enzyme
MSNKKIAVYFTDDGINGHPLLEEEYLSAYFELSETIKNLGSEMYIVRTFGSYKGSGMFSRSWKYGSTKEELIECGEIKVDVVYDKGDGDTLKAEDVSVVNSRKLNLICSNKKLTYDLFQDISPKSFQPNNKEDLLNAVAQVTSKKVVVKPLLGFEGREVRIVDKEEVDEKFIDSTNFPVIVQEFIDSSHGIPGIVEGIHDLRITLLNGEVVMCFVRTPPPGGLLASVAQGGTLSVIDFKNIPSEAISLAEEVDKELSVCGRRLYSVDMAFIEGNPVLIELNSRPGIRERSRGVQAEMLMDSLAHLLVD